MNKSHATQSIADALTIVSEVSQRFQPSALPEEVGVVESYDENVVWARGLGSVKADEVLLVDGRYAGMAMEILPDKVGIVMLEEGEEVQSGAEVLRADRVVDIGVGEGLLGRVVDPLGNPRDHKGPYEIRDRIPIEREAPPIMHRAPVVEPLETGLKVIDALFPIGRGQRELILGDRQTGKTALALDTIMNQQKSGVVCIYCAIGQRSSSVAKAVHSLKTKDALEHAVVMVVEGDEPAGMQYIAPYAATTLGEYFMSRGRDVLIVYDDLTRHAQAYRQISLLLRRPPGREAFPGDVFYIHSKLLERSTRLKGFYGGGSLTALPIIETEGQNISAYIPTNLISITDGQIYLSPDLFQKGIMPAVDVGLSVSRVGGKAQKKAYRRVAADLRLTYTQFQELESFSRFGTRLDDKTRAQIEHGKRVREVLKQKQFSTLSASHQIVVLLAVTTGMLDDLPVESMALAEEELIAQVSKKWKDLDRRMSADGSQESFWNELMEEMRYIIQGLRE